MKCKFINVLMFAAGAAVGSAVTWKVVKTRYERIVQEEIDSVKEAFTDRFDNSQGKSDTGSDLEDDEMSTHTEQIDWSDLEDLEEDDEDDEDYIPEEYDLNQYTMLTKNYTNEKGGADDMANDAARAPYVIAPLEFGDREDEGYRQISLTYYTDDVLEDNKYRIITNRDELIGPEALTTFGDYEEDSVFVRNERLKTDYEILKEYRTYAAARSIGPDQVDDE